MADKKSILEEALLDIKNIQSALNANTKEILRSVAREEIDGVVKESLTKEVYEEEEVDSVNEESHKEHEAGESEKEEKAEHGKGGSEKKEKAESKKMTEGMDTEGMETEGMGAEGMAYEEGMDDLGASEELDMTSASDEDVIAIYKKLSGDDEIEIVGDEIHLSVSEPGEYVIKTSDLEAAPEMEPEMEPEMGDEEGDVDYEIEMGDEEDGEEPTDLMPVDDEEGEEEEEEETEEETEEPIEEKISIGTGMSVGTHRNKTAAGSIGAPENPKAITESAKKLVSETTKKYNLLLTETRKLKSENEQFRGALKEFRTKLVETVVFNSNLTYVTKLFTEHATTKGEKQNIIKRFDELVTNLKESKKLYKTIANELESRKPISESVENKIIKEATTSSSKQLNESTAYVDPSTKRILDLINRVERK
ncbi:MAG: hypothetical protein WCK82_00500 [Bacteroidota bacterium]